MVDQKIAEQLKKEGTDPFWRLNHLYHIIDETGKDVVFKMRPAQVLFYFSLWFFNLILKARQLGFTTLIDLIGLDMCIFTPNFSAVIIAETKEKAADIFNRKIVYPYEHLPQELKDWCRIVNFSKSGEIKFSNGSSIKVMVSARSGTCQFLHISEYGPVCAKSPAKAEEIKTGSLPAVHPGGYIFIESTAMGNEGNFFDMVQMAKIAQLCGRNLSQQEYRLHFFPWHQNPAYVSDSEITIPDRLLKYFDELFTRHGIELSEEQMAWYAVQEQIYHEKMWCEYPSYVDEAFKVAQDGAYYARQFDRIYRENRITMVPWEAALPVHTFWDLGMSDETSIWFMQFIGKEARAIDYYESNGEGLAHYITVLGEKPYRYGRHYAPHDIEVRELGSGLSRRAMALKLGLKMEVVPANLDLLAGIEECRDLLGYMWFSEEKCGDGLKCLQNYKKEWDDKGGCYKNRPAHDAASHGADAFRTAAVARKLGMIPGFGRDAFSNQITVTGGLRK